MRVFPPAPGYSGSGWRLRCRHCVAMIAASSHGAECGDGVPNAMQGFSQNRASRSRSNPPRSRCATRKKEATFAGNVKVVQGDTTMTSRTLVVFYESASTATAPAGRFEDRRQTGPVQSATPARRHLVDQALEARGNVVVTRRSVVTGETAVFDTKTPRHLCSAA